MGGERVPDEAKVLELLGGNKVGLLEIDLEACIHQGLEDLRHVVAALFFRASQTWTPWTLVSVHGRTPQYTEPWGEKKRKEGKKEKKKGKKKKEGKKKEKKKSLVRSALNELSGQKKWHFVTDSNSFFSSPAIQTQLKEAKSKFSLFI